MSKTLVGIDPGINGGIAWIRDGELACCKSMPQTEGDLIALLREINACVIPMPPHYSAAAVQTSVNTHNSSTIVYLEDLVKHAGPKLPASTMAVYARNFGFIVGAVMMAGMSLKLVRAQEWQKSVGLGTRSKGQSKTEWKNKAKASAQRLYPHLNVTLKIADALMILEHARKTEMPKDL